jgi:hypothetical protein
MPDSQALNGFGDASIHEAAVGFYEWIRGSSPEG